MRTFFGLYCTIFLLLSISIIAGDDGRPPFPIREKGFFVECHALKSDGNRKEVVTYRLQNSILLFAKEDNVYTASFSIQVQVIDSLDKVLSTEIVDRKISAKSYDAAISDASTQGMIQVSFQGLRPRASITLTDKSTNREIWHRDMPIEAVGPMERELLFSAVVESFRDNNCSIAALQNYGSSIPFSDKSSDLIVSVPRTGTDSLKLQIKGVDTSYTFISGIKKETAYIIDTAESSLSVKAVTDTAVSSFVFKNISQKLFPGRYVLSLGDDTLHGTQPVMVSWIDMPKSLRYPELAYYLLELVDSLYTDSPVFDRYSKKELISIYKFWEKYDPTPGTAFNEKMYSFYRRADFAIDKFSTIKGGDGASTGRGEVFIKFGTPSSVERTVTKGGKMAEIWKYTQLKKEFYFVDYTGAGNYELVNAL
jgi:GWxTD domain-containing protein